MNITLSGGDDLGKFLGGLPTKMVKVAKDILNSNALFLQTHIRQDMFANGTRGGSGLQDGMLNSRSEQLKRAILTIPATIGETIKGGLTFGTSYAKVHIGPRGQSMTITPKRSKFLAIPLPAAQGNHGEALDPPRSTRWGNTIVKKNDQGNLIIYGFQGGETKVAGKTGAAARGKKLVPLFLLRKSVTVKTRIHPEDLLDWVRPRIENDFREKEKEWLPQSA